MEFGILGPLRAIRDGTPMPLGGPRQRAVLARLLLDPGRVVPVDVLVDDVWGGRPPATATKTLQKYVSELRKSLGPTVVTTSGRGYSVDVGGDAVDARHFERLLAEGDHDGALALWRGEALADLPDVPFAVAERSRLQELRLVAVERSLETELGAGRHAEVVPRLLELAEQQPLHERLCGLLMLALYRSGRQVEALQAFRRHRRRLVDELGVEPVEDLVGLERAILRHDPGLDPPMTNVAAPARAVGNLRLPVSSFVGRTAERARVDGALREARLVTLVGPGGVGKTRLAMEVGAHLAYVGGVWLVDLAALTDPRLIAHQVAVAVGVGDQPGQDDEETLIAALEHRDPLLLVLDNCEHVIERAAALVDRIVRTCGDARVLATSRRPLGVDGEHVVPVGPLPDDDACRLFVDRARLAGTPDVDTVTADVAGLCRSLDGLPLALELVAGQLRALGPDEVAARLDQRLRFASSRFDAPPRQRTLRDLVAWSHELLPPRTQRVFARLAVFATTLTLEAAAAVCDETDAIEHVAALVDHSLLVREPGPTPVRFRLLDTLRLFASEKLDEAGEGEPARRAHAEFYLGLLQAAGPQLVGPAERTWTDRIEVEEPNLHAALAWAAESDRELALRLGIALWPYWDLRWRERYAIAYFTSVLDSDGPPIMGELRAWVRTAMADLVANPGEARLATQWAGEAADLFRAEGNEPGLAAALLALGSAYGNEGALDRADAALDEALDVAHRIGDAPLVARALNFTSYVATRRGDHHLAEQLSREELAAWRALGSRRGEATALRHLAVALQHLGDLEQATQHCDLALTMWQQMDVSAAVAHAQTTLADIARLRGQLDRALSLYEEAFVELRRIGDRRCTASTYKNLAVIAGERGDHRRSTALFLEAVRLRYELGDYAGLAECFDGLAGNMAAVGRNADAETLLAAAQQRRRESGAVPSAEEVRAAAAVEATIRAAVPAQRDAPAPARGDRVSLDGTVAFVLALDPAGPVAELSGS